MARIFPLICCLFISTSVGQTTIDYIESDAIIANPERGWQKYSITDPNYTTLSNYSNINSNEITNWRTGSDKVTLIFRCFLLNNFMNSSIPITYINNMQKDFDIIRNSGLKCIVRFSYSENINTSIQQPPKTLILTHINQIAPLLENNKDIIVTHQAGFIGTYGEWYYTNSTEFGSEGNITSAQWLNRREIVDAMLNATPITIPIQVRYPLIKKILYQNTPLSPSTAYENTSLARVGFYNDAFLNVYGDQGTYTVNNPFENPGNSPDYTYLSNETKYTPMSGETNGINTPRTNGDNALFELEATNWSFMNKDYFEQNITNWIGSGHFETMTKRLGYRFVLKNSTFTLNNNILSVKINLENKGYARPFKKRIAYLVLKNNITNLTYNFTLNTDIRNWENTVLIDQNFVLNDLPNGQFSSYLYLPDIESGLQNKPEYSVQLANANCWDYNTGFNNLNQIVSKNSLDTYEDFIMSKLKVYPNPIDSELNIDLGNIEKAQIRLCDTNGKTILETTIENLNNKLLLGTLNSGMYYLTISNDIINKSFKIVKL